MKVTVDLDLCESHGQCAIAAPEVFSINDNGDLEYDSAPDPALHDVVQEAADVCPAQAIRFED